MDISPKDSQTLFRSLHIMSYSQSFITLCSHSRTGWVNHACHQQEKFIHVKCCAREALYSNSIVILVWLMSTRAPNIPFKCTWPLQRVICLSIFTFDHILCLLLSLIYPAVYLLIKDLCDLSVSRYST